MNGCVLPNGERLPLTPFDVAVLADIGYPLAAPSLTADFNGDGSVDGADFLVWQRGESPDPFSASDLTIWKARYGAGVDAVAAATTVPEPTTAPLLVVSATTAAYWRRRRIV